MSLYFTGVYTLPPIINNFVSLCLLFPLDQFGQGFVTLFIFFKEPIFCLIDSFGFHFINFYFDCYFFCHLLLSGLSYSHLSKTLNCIIRAKYLRSFWVLRVIPHRCKLSFFTFFVSQRFQYVVFSYSFDSRRFYISLVTLELVLQFLLFNF